MPARVTWRSSKALKKARLETALGGAGECIKSIDPSKLKPGYCTIEVGPDRIERVTHLAKKVDRAQQPIMPISVVVEGQWAPARSRRGKRWGRAKPKKVSVTSIIVLAHDAGARAMHLAMLHSCPGYYVLPVHFWKKRMVSGGECLEKQAFVNRLYRMIPNTFRKQFELTTKPKDHDRVEAWGLAMCFRRLKPVERKRYLKELPK